MALALKRASASHGITRSNSSHVSPSMALAGNQECGAGRLAGSGGPLSK
jgi:hypothetical protein